jgi:hypothetical protein
VTRNSVSYSDPFGLCPICDGADIGFFLYSAGKAIFKPTRENLTNVALDGVGLLPLVPSAGMIRRIGDLAEGAKKIHGRVHFRGPSGPAEAYKHLEKFHGVDPNDASLRLHKLKEAGGLRPNDDVVIGATGDVYNARTGDRLGSLTDRGLGSGKRSSRERR